MVNVEKSDVKDDKLDLDGCSGVPKGLSQWGKT